MPRTREEAEALARRLRIPDDEMEEFLADQTGGPPAKVEEAVVAEEPAPAVKESSVKAEEKPPAPRATAKPKPKYAALAEDAPVKVAPPAAAPPKPVTKYAALAEPTIGNAPTFQRSMPEGSPVGRAVRAVEAVIAPPPPASNMAEIRKQDAAVYRPDDAFRADYDYLVGQGYPAQSLDAVIADPARGAAAIAKLAKAKREGKL